MTFPERLAIVRLESCLSTNDYLKAHWPDTAGRLPILVLSREQTAGRGRDQRRWFSAKDLGVYASFGFPIAADATLALLPLGAGLAVVETLETLSGRSFHLKWPNDVLCERRRKIGGVLCESFVQGPVRGAIAGIGVNVAQQELDFPIALRWSAASLAMIMADPPPLERVSALLATAFLAWISRLDQGDIGPLIEQANRRSHFLQDQPVTLRQRNVAIRGVFRGIAPDGGLILESQPGERKVYYAGHLIC